MAPKKTLDIVPVQRWRVPSIVRRPDAFFSVTPTMPCIVQENETVALFPFSEMEDLAGQLILGVIARYIPDLCREMESALK